MNVTMILTAVFAFFTLGVLLYAAIAVLKSLILFIITTITLIISVLVTVSIIQKELAWRKVRKP